MEKKGGREEGDMLSDRLEGGHKGGLRRSGITKEGRGEGHSLYEPRGDGQYIPRLEHKQIAVGEIGVTIGVRISRIARTSASE